LSSRDTDQWLTITLDHVSNSFMSNTKHAKHSKVCFKSSEGRDKGVKMFNEFFRLIEKEEKQEMKDHVILESISDHQEAIVLTF
jgi:hypothetical protein